MALGQVSPNRRFRLSDAIEKFRVGCKLDFEPASIRENPEHVLSGLQIFFDFTMC